MLKCDVKGDVSGSHEDGGEGRTRCQSARATRARKGGQGIEHASKGFHSQLLELHRRYGVLKRANDDEENG